MKSWKEIENASNTEIIQWAAEQPWGQDMAACLQDAQWHAEGDVWTHTKLVLEELDQLPEWTDLDRLTKLKLIFTAFFHDAGKPATTSVDPITGRTHSPKHALVGMEICRSVLRTLGCPLTLREEICNLVRYHGRPPYLLEKPDPAHEVIYLSWLVNHQLLYWFALADTRGRVTQDTSRAEENLHLWRLMAEENNCFTQPYCFGNDHARFLFFQGTLSSLHYTPREDYRCTVTVMSGLPGSGKDSWLKQHCPDLPVVSLDEVRHELDIDATENQGTVIQAAREACRQYLRDKRDFAFNATNTMRLTRKRWLDLFTEYGARLKMIYLEPPLATLFARNKNRKKPVPQQVIEHLVDKLEPPTAVEAHSVSWFS